MVKALNIVSYCVRLLLSKTYLYKVCSTDMFLLLRSSSDQNSSTIQRYTSIELSRGAV